jgi:hypothetical protein
VVVPGVAWSQNDSSPVVPPGSEIVQIEGNRLVVPKGTILKKVGASILMEDLSAYVARQLSYMEERLARIEQSQEGLRQETEDLRNIVKELQAHSAKPSAPEVNTDKGPAVTK